MRGKNMNAMKVILWVQIALGLAGGVMALAAVCDGAMLAKEWAHTRGVEYEKLKQAPRFVEPAKLGEESWDRMLEDWQAEGMARARVAGYWAMACVALVVFGLVELWLVGRVSGRLRSG